MNNAKFKLNQLVYWMDNNSICIGRIQFIQTIKSKSLVVYKYFCHYDGFGNTITGLPKYLEEDYLFTSVEELLNHLVEYIDELETGSPRYTLEIKSYYK